MSEAILIEIATRFRQLEDAIEAAGLAMTTDEDVREEIEKALEACRDDMVAMQELIRGKA